MTYVGVLSRRAASAPRVRARSCLAQVPGLDVTTGQRTYRGRPPAMERLDASAATHSRSPEAPALPGREEASG